MSRLLALKEKLASKSAVLGTTIANVAWSGLAQKIAAQPFDFVVLDEEHGTLSTESAEAILRVCRLVDLPTIVRVPDAVPHLISKTLDMGADGVMLPRVESLNQVEIAVRAARYYPRGRKGCGGFSNLRAEDKGSVETYNDNRMIMLQMESYEGLAVLPEILEKYSKEIAAVVIGPYDASIMVGTPLDITSPTMVKFISDVFEVCGRYDVACGSFVDHAGMLEHYRKLGANVFWTGTELSLLTESYQNLCNTFKKVTE